MRRARYALDRSLVVRDFHSRVLQDPGPVLLLRPVQENTIVEVRRRIGVRVPVDVCDVTCVEELEAALDRLCGQFDAGEPAQALDLVVALLLMRKLDQEHMWTGNAKGYMWASDIPKGRGLKEEFAPRVPHVLNVLLQRGYLASKTSKGKTKYALNPDRRKDIYDVLRNRGFPEEVQRIWLRLTGLASVRELDLLDCYDGGQVT